MFPLFAFRRMSQLKRLPFPVKMSASSRQTSEPLRLNVAPLRPGVPKMPWLL